MVTSKIEPCNRKSVDNFFQNRQESDRATFKFIFTIPRTDRSGYRPCPSKEMIVLKHHFILHESPRRPSVRPLETTESVHSSAAYLCEKKYICEYQNSCWGLRPCPHESVLIWKRNFSVYGYGFRPHESDENHQWKRNFSKTLTWVELYENTVLVCTCGQSKTELFENAEDTLSVPKDGGRALHFLVFYPWAYF